MGNGKHDGFSTNRFFIRLRGEVRMELFQIKTHGPLPGTEALYIHVERGRFDPLSGVTENGTILSLHTYFNSFSCSQYRTWTRLLHAKAELDLFGHFKVSLWTDRAGQNIQLSEQETEGSFELPFDFSNEEGDCRYWLKLTALGENCRFTGGRYTTDCQANSGRMAVVICTYQREAYVQKNLEELSSALLASACPISREIEIFLVDNGQTLTGKIEENDAIHLFPNKNLGGSGGFTRGMIEVLKRKERFTHVLLMDDDVVIEPNALFKTLQFMKLLRPEYQDLHLAGGMLTLETPCHQHEATARWKKGRNLPNNQFSLDTAVSLACNELNSPAQYGAWWYLCMPVSVIRPDNLPLPLFIKCDDVEYGFRNIRHITALNGVGIWHKGFDAKYAPWLDYYNTRNILILDTLHFPKQTRMNLPWAMFKRLFSYVARGVPQAGYFLCEGVRDYLKGPSFFLETDQEDKNCQLHEKNAALGILPELSKTQKIIRLARKAFTPIFWCTLRDYIRLVAVYRKERPSVESEWKNNWKQYSNLEIWERILKIPQNALAEKRPGKL